MQHSRALSVCLLVYLSVCLSVCASVRHSVFRFFVLQYVYAFHTGSLSFCGGLLPSAQAN